MPKIVTPSKQRQVTIMPAMSTPIKIDNMACLNFKPRSTASSEPVQAPVIGKGIATNNARPMPSYLSISFPRFLVRSKSHFKIRSKKAILLSSREAVSRNSRMKGTGNILPIMANRKA